MARAMARDLGLDLTTLAGSGPGGRVVKLDVESAREAAAQVPAPAATGAPAAAAPAPSAPTPSPDGERIPLSNMRKTVARRLTESMQSAPHFYLTTVAGADALMTFRAELNERYEKAGEDVRLSLNDLIVKACGRALGIHPEVNVSWAGDAIIRHRHVNVGIAVAVEGGLIVPVIHDTDQKSVSQISREAKGLIERARSNRLTPAEYTGSTFTVTNLGMYGIDQFTAVINPPEAAILAVGTVSPELVLRDGKVASRQVMKLTLAIDHRPLDGATGAVFLRDLKTLLEDPLRIVA
jgi:pyruvate dehydrogenase E2 component (dihydrolipoamide acetyltransferase)